MESPQTTISCGRFFQHPYSESVGFRRVSAHVPSYGSIGDQQSVPKPNLTGKLLILNRMKAMAIAGPFQNLSYHFKTNDVLSGAKRTRARSSAVSRQVRAGKRRVRTGRAFEMSWNQSWRRSLGECTHKLGLLDSVRARFCGRRLLLRRFVTRWSMAINVALVDGMRVTLPVNSNRYRCGPIWKVT